VAFGVHVSDIAAVEEEIDLDFADNQYLNIVTANLGVILPVFGFSDDVWRAVVKAIALRYKQIRSAFEEVLSIVLGPRVTQVSILANPAVIGDTQIVLVGSDGLPQTGTLALDTGLVVAETVGYRFIDRTNNTVYLATPLANAHGAVGNDTFGNISQSIVGTTALSGSATLVLQDSSSFPTVNYPYSVLVGAGTSSEETLSVTDNNTGTNTLTFAALTTQSHLAPTPSVIHTTLVISYGASSLFLVLTDTKQLPNAGYLRISGNIVRYISNDSTTGTLSLHRELGFSPAAGTLVELLENAQIITLSQIEVKGCGWDLYQVTPRKVEVLVSPECQDIRTLFNASYLHGDAVPSVATTLSGPTSAGDTTLPVVSTVGFPNIGTVVVDIGASQEILGYNLDITLPNTLVLPTHPAAFSHLGGTNVTLYEPVLTGNLLSGDIWHTPDVWAGPYVYQPGENGPKFIRTTLPGYLSGPTYVALGVEDLTNTALEVEDASYFPTTFPFTARLGATTGDEESVEVDGVFYRQRIRETVSGIGAFPNQLPVSGGGAAFPHKKGYRVVIDRLGLHEEIAYVQSISGGSFVFEQNLVNPHAIGELVELVNDTLSIVLFGNVHADRIPFSVRNTTRPSFAGINPNRAELVQVLYPSFDVTAGATFATAPTNVLLNFGNNRVSARQMISSNTPAGSNTIFLVDSSLFPPSAACPYFVKMGEGMYNQEIVEIMSNNMGLNQLTINPAFPAHYDHFVGEYVQFDASEPELIEYQSRIGNTFNFTDPLVLNSNHTIGETVTEATESLPSPFGTDFPFHIPSTVISRLEFLLDLVRAAGIEVDFIDRK